MNIKKILFVLIVMAAPLSHAFANFSFLQKKYSARKAGLEKMGIGAALIAAAHTQTNSVPVNIAQNIGALSGGACMIAGLYQILVDVLAEPEAKSDLHPDSSRLDKIVNNVITNKMFVTGAGLGLIGFLLQNSDGTVSDTSLACNVAALTLMGLTIGAELHTNYTPEIIAFFNK